LSDDDSSEGPDEPGDPDIASAEVLPEPATEPLGIDPSIEAAPDSGAAEEYLRRARLAEDRLAEVLAAYRKIRSENDGFRERITRNVERRFDQRRERLLLKFIDILDNLDRALEAAEHAGNPLIEGLILVRTQLLQTLQEEGLERIPVLGMPYDPNFAEAVATQPVDDPEHHHLVVKELMRGYRLSGRVARPSRVLVGEHGAALAQAAPEDDGLIGADEVTPGEAAAEVEPEAAVEAEAVAEPEAMAEAEASLEDIIARVAPRHPPPELAIPEEAGLPEEGELEALPADALPDELPASELVPDELFEGAPLPEADFVLGEPISEPAEEPVAKAAPHKKKRSPTQPR
jgi:molecular chaperone GrpE